MKSKLTLFLGATFTLLCSHTAVASSFIDAVNVAWKTRNYDQILQLANAEAAKSPVNPEAYVVLYKYNIYVTRNDQQAAQYLNQLISIIETTAPSAAPGLRDYRTGLLAASDGRINTTPTAQELEKLHRLFPDAMPTANLVALIQPQ